MRIEFPLRVFLPFILGITVGLGGNLKKLKRQKH